MGSVAVVERGLGLDKTVLTLVLAHSAYFFYTYVLPDCTVESEF
jgi:hypothetical protein